MESRKQILPILNHYFFQLNPFQFQLRINSFHIVINYSQQNQHYKGILYTLELSIQNLENKQEINNGESTIQKILIK